MRQPHQDELLDHHLRTYLGNIEPAALAELRACLEWMDVPGGQTLMTQGEPGDAMYLVLSGRLRAYVNDEDGTPRAVREMGRGQIVGEMSVITGEPRLATVVTVRDSVLVRLAKTDFNRLLATSPQLSVVLTRQIIEHLQSREDLFRAARPVTIGLLPISAGVHARAFAQRLARNWPTRPGARRRCGGVDADLEVRGWRCDAVEPAGACDALDRDRGGERVRAAGRRRHADALDAALLPAGPTRSCCWPTPRSRRRCIRPRPNT